MITTELVASPELREVVSCVGGQVTVTELRRSVVTVGTCTNFEVLAVVLNNRNVFSIVDVLSKLNQSFVGFSDNSSINEFQEVSSSELYIPSSSGVGSHCIQCPDGSCPSVVKLHLVLTPFHPSGSVVLSNLPWTVISIENIQVALVQLTPSGDEKVSVVGLVCFLRRWVDQLWQKTSNGRFEVETTKEKLSVVSSDPNWWVVVVEGR